MNKFTATVVRLVADTLNVIGEKEVGDAIFLMVETSLGNWEISIRKDTTMIFTRFENIKDIEFAKKVLGRYFIYLNPHSFKWNLQTFTKEEAIQELKDRMALFKKDKPHNLVAGDTFFDVIGNNKIVKYEYLCKFPSKNNNSNYHILINKNDSNPIRIFEEHLSTILEKGILTLEQAKKVVLIRLKEEIKYYENETN